MNIIDNTIQNYIEDHTSQEPKLLEKIRKETYDAVPLPNMLSGFLQGRLLSVISKMLTPSYILEVGTYTGYSSLCLAEGLSSEGRLVTIDINQALEGRVRKYFEQAGLAQTIDYYIGNALDIIPSLSMHFDLVFIDADKKKYTNYYELVLDKMSAGGVILVDNVLWKGKVITNESDATTRAIMQFNDMIKEDIRVEHIMLPIRDGITVIRKK